ncbi:MAG: restriction endonuclease subunit S [Methanosarcina sp.]|jgi:type I restriction enzyme S subunit|uniref:Type I restriction-modification system specificity subunit n=1 Tax=Methanosarcina mazei (strain ATCC BAA-159 / DSM 3647 / Goe1 / Go1 / JCM 11833 / OCM 88) TaxID=192952 RepID=Q8PSU8_METMA|nr:restriction endonuclease subunit S [Methanosarcina mazei]AAM32674.1 type I restriction-modification system specificity subunit [Methanosarcina mazei Go1]MDY0245884.1 restriction endonuclease subunit S [Methanosarcina mazei]WIM42895.1 restriction endonuclease subunit S [Methanosarcina mazei]WIM46356.1 restriction endonuclease subunit S [Methanosarcina mazei]
MIHNLKPYPAYKDSGVPWLGEVPEHWKLKRTKTVLRERSQKGFPDEPLLAATQTKGVVRKELYENRTVLALKDLHLLKLVRVNDFVISLRSFQGGIEFAHEQGIISPAYTILYPVEAQNHGFLAWLFKSKPYIENLSLFVTGIREGQNIDYVKLSRSELPLPPFSEQSSIVRYLDHIDRRIRRYIHAKQKFIKLLEEQKQAIIHQSVTHGLDPNVKLKPSGLEWLGDVPEHWEVKPAKWYYHEIDERSSTGSEELLSVSHITGVTPRSEKNITMFMAESYVGYKLCRENDLVINTMWAWMAALGVAQQTGIVSYSYGVYRPIHKEAFLSQYIDLLLRTKPYVAEYICRSTGIHSSRLRLYPEQFLRIPIIRPPIVEQQAILDEIHNKTSELEHAINTSNQEISLLREYRTRLIADVVTGKLDVREAVTNLKDGVEEPEIEEYAEESITEELEEVIIECND